MTVQQPIDAIISWVDGYDPQYQQKLDEYCKKKGIQQEAAIEPTRTQQCGEIYYCLHSIKRFAPWIRTIYLVTDNQTPAFLSNLKACEFFSKIKVINLQDLFKGFEDCFPTFNSLTIEWLLWKTEGLSNQFIYFNDDVFLTRPVKPEDFFEEGCIVLRGQWKLHSEHKWRHIINRKFKSIIRSEQATTPMSDPHRHWQEKSAKYAGWHKYYYLLPHAPFPLLRDTFKHFVAENPLVFANNLSFPFRNVTQMSAIPLMAHLDMKQGHTVVNTTLQAITVNGSCHSLRKIKSRLKGARKRQDIAFLCVQSLDQADGPVQSMIIQWLEEQICQ